MRLCARITSADDAWTSPLLLVTLWQPWRLFVIFVATLVTPKMSAGSMLVQKTNCTRIAAIPREKESPTTTATMLRLRTLPLYPKSPSLQEMRVLSLHPLLPLLLITIGLQTLGRLLI